MDKELVLVIMNIDELKHILHPENPNAMSGNMCFNCGRKKCKFVLFNDMYFGQEVGEDEKGNTIVYECPKYEYPTRYNRVKSWETLKTIDDAIDHMRYLTKVIDDLNKEVKLNYVYRKYSK